MKIQKCMFHYIHQAVIKSQTTDYQPFRIQKQNTNTQQL